MVSKPHTNNADCNGDGGSPYVFLDDNIAGHSRYYQNPIKIITAREPGEVALALAAIDKAARQGYHLAGYASYELGLCLDPRLQPLLNKDANLTAPLLCFGVFEGYNATIRLNASSQISKGAALPRLTPQWSQSDYTARFDTLLDYIRAGDIYQANLTFPYMGHSKTAPDLPFLYGALRGRQPVRYGAVISLCAPDILSLSPELFFKIENGQISARPMKGTAPRSSDPDEDAAIGAAMLADEKSRAENLMIVDLLRNDISRISEVGSVTVTDLFTLETFPTLHQMTSGITARLLPDATPSDIFKALFPCGSVTGAPKVRAMEIIAELEDTNRGPYCGAIGYFDPDGNSAFNVAIRTLISTPANKGGFDLSYRVGSGVVYDSDGQAEYAECRLKAQILDATEDNLQLVETLLWTPQYSFARLEEHMLRLMKTAYTLGYICDLHAVFAALDNAVSGQKIPCRVRLTVSKDGQVNVTHTAYIAKPEPMKLRIAKQRLDSHDPSLRFKRAPCPTYLQARERLATMSDCDEMVFLNENGHVCEGSYTNIFARIDGQLYTPPLSCGLLPGILRGDLLESGIAKERILTVTDLTCADAIFIGNALRGLCPAVLDTLEEI